MKKTEKVNKNKPSTPSNYGLGEIEFIDVSTFFIGIVSLSLAIIYAVSDVGESEFTTKGLMTALADGAVISLALMYVSEKIITLVKNQKRDKMIQDLVSNTQIAVNREIKGVNVSIETLRREVDSVISCQYLGGKDDGLHYLRGRLPHAIKCYNTFVAYGVEPAQRNALLYSDGVIDDISEVFFEMLKGQNSVVSNIVSEDTRFFTDSLNEKIVGLQKNEIKGTHLFGVLKHKFPVLNFTVIEYSNKKEDREVIFGWGHHQDDWNGATFASSDMHMISSFMSYYKSISNHDLCDWHEDIIEPSG